MTFSTAGFVLKPNDSTIKERFEKIKEIFVSNGISVMLAKRSAQSIGESGVEFEQMCNECDFLVSLGGDGTLLSLVRRSYRYKKPVVGINAGNLGFLADIKIDEVEEFVALLKSGRYRIDDRLMLTGKIEKADGTTIELFALNDIVISSATPSSMVIVNASIDSERFNSYRGDGLIISTPTGSTAYNLAAGGPVVYPLTQALILTPLLAHSLANQRPLVVPSDFRVSLQTQTSEAIVTADGQQRHLIEDGDTLHVTGAKDGAKLIHKLQRNYFSVLREKLHWGDRNW